MKDDQRTSRNGAKLVADLRLRGLAAGRDEQRERDADFASGGKTATGPSARVRPVGMVASDLVTRHLGRGDALSRSNREQYEAMFGADLGDVRVHRGHAATASSRMLGANGWTLGRDVVLGVNPAPSLLAHELAHVVQQCCSGIGRAGGPAPIAVQRQPVAASATTYSVDQSSYLGKVGTAVADLDGRFVGGQTLTGRIVPILSQMLAAASWSDAQGVRTGGTTIQFPVMSKRSVSLSFVFDDAIDPRAGSFSHTGATIGEMRLFVQNCADAEEIALTLYHEGLHLLHWLSGEGLIDLAPRGHEGPSGAARTLESAASALLARSVRTLLDDLALSVNGRRGQRTKVSGSELDWVAPWLVEELSVRIETEVFRQARFVQEVKTKRGSHITIGQDWVLNGLPLDSYLFSFSHVFDSADRDRLSVGDRELLGRIVQLLRGWFEFQVARRFSMNPYLVTGGPRARVDIPLSPIIPPTSFGDPPLPP